MLMSPVWRVTPISPCMACLPRAAWPRQVPLAPARQASGPHPFTATPSISRLVRQNLQKRRRVDDGSPVIFLEHQQVLVFGHQVIGLRGLGRGQKLVVRGVATHWWNA